MLNYYKILENLKNNKLENIDKLIDDFLDLSNLDSMMCLDLGVRLLRENKHKTALKCLEKCIFLNPHHYSAYTNIGVIYYKFIFNIDLAIEYFLKSIKLKKENPSALYNLGCCYADLNNFDKSLFSFKKALSFNPNHYRAKYNLSLKELSIQDYKNGWKNFEVRKKILNIKEDLLGIPIDKIWNGTSKENVLIVHSEQGIGDEILISSLYSELNLFHKKIRVSCDKRLISIFSRSFKNIEFFDKKETIKANISDKHIFSFSLGQYLRKNKKDFGNNKFSWINTSDISDNFIGHKIKKINKLKIGISWKSNTHLRKSIDLKEIIKIIPLKDYEILNLQYGDVKNDILEVNKKLNKEILYFEDIDYKNDFESLCSIIKQCDFIITTSNVTAHFAGALSINTNLLLPTNSIWYWGYDNNSPWYPSINIFRQKTFNDWVYPLEMMKKKLFNKKI